MELARKFGPGEPLQHGQSGAGDEMGRHQRGSRIEDRWFRGCSLGDELHGQITEAFDSGAHGVRGCCAVGPPAAGALRDTRNDHGAVRSGQNTLAVGQASIGGELEHPPISKKSHRKHTHPRAELRSGARAPEKLHLRICHG